MASFRFHSMFIQTIYVSIIETLFISVLLASPTPQFFFPTNDVNFQNDEYQDVKKCLDDDYSMPYFNPSTQEFPCHKLLTQGPCEDGQWFVIGNNTSPTNTELPTAECKERECLPIQIPNKNSYQETVLFNDKCVNVTEECKKDNMVVLVNPFGEGECGCKPGFIEWLSKDGVSFTENVKCYQEYLQGPCPAGYQLVPKDDVDIFVKVNGRQVDIPIWFGTSTSHLTSKKDAEDNFGSMCIPSDCTEEGYVRSKSGSCFKSRNCSGNQTLILSNKFKEASVSTDITSANEQEVTESCCMDDEEIKLREFIDSDRSPTEPEKQAQLVLKKNACGDLLLQRFAWLDIAQRSALVTIPESCPRGQTITHDGECKHVRIWRSRPRRSANSNSRIRQMMRYVRALRRSRPGSARIAFE